MADLSEIENWGELHQVWFAHDYFTLKFENDDTIRFYNKSWITDIDSLRRFHGEEGFCDQVVKCINSNVIEIEYIEKISLEISFNNSMKLTIGLDKESNTHKGPEAFEIPISSKLACYIEFNE